MISFFPYRGQGVAGFLGPRFGWRLPFLVVSIPAMVCAVLVWMFVPEVERGAGDKTAQIMLVTSSSTMDQNNETDEDRELELAGRIENEDASSCTMRKTAQATSRTTLVGDTPEQGLYVHLDDQSSSSSTNTPTNTRYIGCMEQYYQKYIHQHVQTFNSLLCHNTSVLLGIFQGAPGCIPVSSICYLFTKPIMS